MAEGGTATRGLNTLEDEARTGDGGTSSKTVEVRGFSLGTSHDLLEMYFENSRRSGGGDIEELQIKDDVAYITFEVAEVVQKVLSHSPHQVAGQTLTVTQFCPPLQKPCYENRVLVQRLNSDVTEELLTNFLETETGIKVTEFLYGKEEGKVVVTFSNCIDFAALRKACSKRRLKGNFLQVTKVAISNCIFVKNLQPSTSHEFILFYFENKRSGGGEIERVEMNTAERYCLVYFVDCDVIETVLCQQHNIEGANIEVHLHHECLGRRSSRSRSDPFLGISKPEMKENLLETETSSSVSSNPDTDKGCDFAETLLKDETSSSISSNPDKGCDFVEIPKWQEDDGKNCVIPLWIKYKMASERTIIKDMKKVACSWNFHVFWNFFTKTKPGQQMFDDILKKRGCSVTVSSDDDDLFIFEISDESFEKQSEVIDFIKDALGNVYACAQQSLFSDIFLIDHRMLEDILQKVKQMKEMDSAWIELVGEQEPDAICVVCTAKDKESILQVVTVIKAAVQVCFDNHENVVTIDLMWQKVLKKFGYLQEVSVKFPNLTITPDETKSAVMLKGPRDQSNAAAEHLKELLGTAHAEVQEDIFSPGCQFDIFTYPEMCDYIDSSIIKLPCIWIPNHQTMKIHLFSKKSEPVIGMDKFIKGCIKERLYSLPKQQSMCCPKIVRSLEEFKKKHKGKIVIDQSPTGIILTTADDIFESVDAVVQEIISIEPENVQSGHVIEKHVKRDGQLVSKSEYKINENQRKTEYSLWSKKDVSSEQNTKDSEGLKSMPDIKFDQLEVMIQPEIKAKPSSDAVGKIEDRKTSAKAKEHEPKQRDWSYPNGKKITLLKATSCDADIIIIPEKSGKDSRSHFGKQIVELNVPDRTEGKAKTALRKEIEQVLNKILEKTVAICIKTVKGWNFRRYLKCFLYQINECFMRKRGKLCPVECAILLIDDGLDFTNALEMFQKFFKSEQDKSKVVTHEMVLQGQKSIFERIRVKIQKGMLHEAQTEVLVNTVAKDLDLRKGLISSSLLDRAGVGIQKELHELHQYKGNILFGQVLKTGVGILPKPCKVIFHGALYSYEAHPDSVKVFQDFLLCCLEDANKYYKSIAFPPIGTGRLGFPKELVASLMFQSVAKFEQAHPVSKLEEVIFVIYEKDQETLKEFEEIYRRFVGASFEKVTEMHATEPQGASPGLSRKVLPKAVRVRPKSPVSAALSEEDCPICLKEVKSPKTLSCGHTFCIKCIEKQFRIKSACPECGTIYGDQPEGGEMKVSTLKFSLKGFDRSNTLKIEYRIPSGNQGPNHPKPGKSYSGIAKTAYLPDTAEGRKVCELLKVAFERRLIFTLGRSTTLGEDCALMWNGIHHKTDCLGVYGYPDPGYLKRVQEQLAAKGVTETDLKS